MCLHRILNLLYLTAIGLLINMSQALAEVQDIGDATEDFSTKMLTIFKGPLVKIVAGIVLFAGVGSLLRGKHAAAVSCGIAFILLLMLPFMLQYVGDGH